MKGRSDAIVLWTSSDFSSDRNKGENRGTTNCSPSQWLQPLSQEGVLRSEAARDEMRDHPPANQTFQS
ncbi:MAG: hypothetical protein AUJ04_04710 [Acidobacteria bacterium 13_1_40CM_3_55_6]|nr:MAG: hypothetical protein AUJ04_04710 [Acidobacteria bacterium 13_1_40CM_3_55_6]